MLYEALENASGIVPSLSVLVISFYPKQTLAKPVFIVKVHGTRVLHRERWTERGGHRNEPNWVIRLLSKGLNERYYDNLHILILWRHSKC